YLKKKIVLDMKEPCFRCKRPTYFNDKVGPLKDGSLFHKGCFKCWICGTRLSLKTYHNNRNDTQDLEVYCAGHVPTPGPHDPIPHRSNLLFSPKTKGEYPHNLMRPAAPN
uniref:LIM zinc-binding domain-containing protein n=1 Tax=Strongyloides stercoralis TaxID=6248 RepID=A0AAF5DQG8_STRER